MMKKLIKVCGMTEGENIRQVEALGIDFMGFIFFPKSPRCVKSVPSYLPATCQRVGVFVNAELEDVCKAADEFSLDVIQLHGHESVAYCEQLRQLRPSLRLVKVFSFATEADILETDEYVAVSDLFLFDTKCPTAGGSGVSFNWRILDAYKGNVPFLLSGGIGPESVESLVAFSHPMLAGYDLNSKFELAPGLKDAALLKGFLDELKKNKTIENE